MPLDEFKTQVLLLHSDQSTLDELSSGFSDKYTVHCATSGSEALNTLVETPINVLVSAQELPGMSGLDALREARKRSPDMIGILLAGNASSGLEALVGNEEIFKIVRGEINSESLLKLVDEATRQMRLMALAYSANDTTANVDEPAEHIVMETSENGAAIISDGTGRMPALDPEKISAAANIGSRAVDVLVLTKDREFLETIKTSARGMHKVYYANTLAQADEAIRKYKIGVGVVDAAMVGEKVEQLTQHLRKGSPRLVCIVAGRRDDGEMLMDLINRGKVYRFLLKPVSPGRARLAVESSVRHHLEAPDAAFKTKGRPAAAKPAPKLKVKPAKPVLAQKDPPMGSVVAAAGRSPIEDGLADAFGQNDSSLVETVKNLIGTISRKISDRQNSKPVPATSGVIKAKIARTSAAKTAPASAGSGGSLLRNPKILGVGATAVVMVTVALFWALGGSDESAEQLEANLGTPRISETDVIFGTPADALIAAESNATVEQELALAETALIEGQLDAAEAALQRVSAVDAGNARLPFLNAQLSQLKLRGRLNDARVAIREDRFEDAATALNAARSLNPTDTTEVDAIAGELVAARSEQRVDDVLVKAAARVEVDALLSPANDNARYFYELVLTNDAQNSTARQGLNVIASKLALQARSAIDNGDLHIAESLLVDAHAIEPENNDVVQAITVLADARATIVEKRRQAEAAQRAAAEKSAAQAETDRQAALLQTNTQEQREELAVNEDEAVEKVEATLDNESAQAGPPSDDVEVGPPMSAAVAKSDQPPADIRPVATISSLSRIKYVAPKYPRSALRRNLSGWVDVFFTVATDGTVKDVIIRGSEPGDTFVKAATKAVEKWKFEPIVEDGTAVEKKAGVRMMFAL